MYAISHAVTALPIKRWFPKTPLWPLLLSVQALEVLWVLLTSLGVEHVAVSGHRVHLNYLPWSHSIASAVIIAMLSWLAVRALTGRVDLATAMALGIVSHIVLDIIQHEPNIALSPAAFGPRLGFGLTLHPVADVLVELAYGVLCWRLFGGTWGLLAGIVLLNVLDIPFKFPRPGSADLVSRHPAIVTTVVAVQMAVSWIAVWWLSRRRSRSLERSSRM